MTQESEAPATRWVYRQEGGVTLAWQEPIRPESDWVFDHHRRDLINPSQDLTIYSVSRGRDDFGYAGVRLSTREHVFRFDLGRSYTRELTDEERIVFPEYDIAVVWLIVDDRLSDEQRNLVLEWLQAREDEVAFAKPPQKPRRLMRLESVGGIAGY